MSAKLFKGNKPVIVSVPLDERTVEIIDRIVLDLLASSRSEILRDLIARGLEARGELE